uniref:Putative secreted peptide n=1 Tax=Anopheles braziliensis TaxID=58242 RepID=A0A2M3ZUM5_9DIPT
MPAAGVLFVPAFCQRVFHAHADFRSFAATSLVVLARFPVDDAQQPLLLLLSLPPFSAVLSQDLATVLLVPSRIP